METKKPIYPPKEDSFLLAEAVSEYLENLSDKEKTELKVLDLGTGSGIQAEKISEFIPKENLLAADINPEAVKYVKQLGFDSVKSDLFSSSLIQNKKFDLVVFNPPYLPEDESGFDSEPDTTGGEKGHETILNFLRVVKNYLSKSGKVFIVVSSLTPAKEINEEIKNQNFKKEIVKEKKFFFEKLEVWKLD